MSETAEEPDEVDSILAQSVKTTEEGSDPKTWYITCFLAKMASGVRNSPKDRKERICGVWNLRILPSTRRC